MRKIVLVTVMVCFMCGGCSWFGFGENSSTTTVQAEPTSQPESEVKPANPATTKSKTNAKAGKNIKKTTPVKGAKSEAQIKAELDQMGRKLVAQSSRTIMPNKANKEVRQVGGQWVASYIHVDPNYVVTEMHASPSGNGQYVGNVRYQEEFMECRGATKQAALSAPCKKVRSKNLNELIRYDGKAWQD